MPIFTQSQEHILLDVHVQPRAKREGIVGIHGEALKIALREPPADGRANEALVRLLAGELGLRRDDVVLVSGQSSRQKRVRLPGEVRAKLESILAKLQGG